MTITHHPQGTHPHVNTGYHREPLYPETGDKVVVYAMLDDVNAPVSTYLILYSEQTSQTIPGRREFRAGDNRWFFSFDLGSFDTASAHQYRIHANDKLGQYQSPAYGFDVLKRVPLGNPFAFRRENHGVYVDFEHLSLQISLGRTLSLRWLEKSTSARQTPHDLKDYEINFAAGEYQLILKKLPFIWELKRLGILKASWRADRVFLLLDYLGRVRSIEAAPGIIGKRFYGLGERFDGIQLQGKRIDLRVVEKFTKQDNISYLPIPFCFTDQHVAWLGKSWHSLQVDLRDTFKYKTTTMQQSLLYEEHVFAGPPLQLLYQLHHLTGMPVLPPRWTFGVWISSNGWSSQQETLEQLRELQRHALPASALVLEAWSDEKTFYIFNDAQYQPCRQGERLRYSDFHFPKDGRWPDPKALARYLEQVGINLVLWQIPVIKYAWEGPNEQLLLDEQFAIDQGFCLLNEDGSPYRVTDGWFSKSLLLDFTNPQACAWWFGKREYLLDELHVKGFKTDGGEFLFGDVTRLYDGTPGGAAHNAYPGQYIGAYCNWMRNKQVHGVCFSRAGYLGAQTQPVHWAGDQLSLWEEFQAQLSAGISAGLSGIVFWGFDISGFAGDFPEKDLYLRSVAMGAFSPIMQWHSEPRNGQFFHTDRQRWNNDRSPWNLSEYHQDWEILRLYRRFANLRMALIPYLYQEAAHCVKSSRPMMCHLLVDWPGDQTCLEVDDQYMLGRSLLVAPVTQSGASDREVYLPEGRWYELFSGLHYQGPGWVNAQSGLDTIPVYVRENHVIPCNMSKSRILGGDDEACYLGNQTNGYQQLAFLYFGKQNAFTFTDDFGYDVRFCNESLQGEAPRPILLVDVDKPGEGAIVFGRRVKAQLAFPLSSQHDLPS